MPEERGIRFFFLKSMRLVKSSDFKAFREAQQSLRTSLGPFSVLIRKNGKNINRLGVIVTKKASGNLVLRNYLKRQAREFFRIANPQFPKGLDFLFIAKKLEHGQKKVKMPPLKGFVGFLEKNFNSEKKSG
jgi:ribonuclease P protein component